MKSISSSRMSALDIPDCMISDQIFAWARQHPSSAAVGALGSFLFGSYGSALSAIVLPLTYYYRLNVSRESVGFVMRG